MIRVMMYGCNGFMGHVICDLIKDMNNVEVSVGVDRVLPENSPFLVYSTLEEVDVPVDVIIDFSAAPAVDQVLDYAAEKKIPLVECTTGLSEEQLAHLHAVSEKNSGSPLGQYVAWGKYASETAENGGTGIGRSRF